ncbi:alpha/beta hydrolase [Gordonia sp. TBRC 11910]|uniref:Alpha/beta hydrolase n=1 Tax=Gordonia asplenii TaxID=2725283 RepID=A0A848L857_9ACTN|nr:alpha/beta hydrolase [Gordonia asplenii]NMO04661.1 alpha/beta hydrolase [Gordonia asplenii]
MPLDPQAQAWLAGLAGVPALNEMSVDDARATYRAVVEQCGLAPEEVADITERVAPGPRGDVPVRVYTPKGSGLFPVLVYYHGGGWVIGDPDVVHGPSTVIANRAHAVVVSVDYRMGPEDPFPAAVDDSIAVLEWVRANAAELNIDQDRIAVGGDSAGGNLSAVVALDARDKGIPLVGQVLIYPAVDFDLETDSMRENGDGYFLTLDLLKWFVERYAPNPADWRAAPMAADDVSGVASAYVITAEFDPLRDAGEAYTARLRDAGVPVIHKRYDGQIHGFAANLAGVMDQGRAAVESIGEHLREVFRLGWTPRLWE